MCKTTQPDDLRTCVICNSQLYGRSDKVFCDIRCKNKYHAEIRKTTKTISAETLKILNKNWVILAGLMTDKCDRFVLKRITLERQGFNFDTISHIEARGFHWRYSVFEFSYYFGNNDNIVVSQDRRQQNVSPYLFKRWRHILPTIPEEHDELLNC
jgi:hypothetical protein